MNIKQLKKMFLPKQIERYPTRQDIEIKHLVMAKRLVERHDMFACYFVVNMNVWKNMLVSGKEYLHVYHQPTSRILGTLYGQSIFVADPAVIPDNVVLAFTDGVDFAKLRDFDDILDMIAKFGNGGGMLIVGKRRERK